MGLIFAQTCLKTLGASLIYSDVEHDSSSYSRSEVSGAVEKGSFRP